MEKTFTQIIESYRPWLVEVRRDLHRHPEPAFEEVRTAGIMAENLKSFGLEFRAGVGKTGVVGLLRKSSDGPTVAVRGDMDCLPIQEENDVPYASTRPGFMHACGHDAHTTIILGTARFLSENPEFLEGVPGQVKFIFQPAEEGRAGAAAMIRDGVLSDPPVDAIFGAHMVHTLPAGVMGLTPGAALAAFDRIEILVTGKGGHAARPQSTVDPVVTASYLVTALQSIVSRNINPLESAVLTIGSINAGNAFNVIPSSAVLVGTLRTLSGEVREIAKTRIREMSERVAAAFGATAEVEIEEGYPIMLNDPDTTAFLGRTFRAEWGEEPVKDLPPIMASEDFAYYLEQVPGTYFRLGCGNVERGITHSMHTSKFDIDEDVLPFGVTVFSHLIREYLKRAKGTDA
ncbi:MAG: amidohydrolase [Nitrospinota bacterium]|jgi:amidohydrolase|nr:amidohydrolase [Nitrospinota bacterium]